MQKHIRQWLLGGLIISIPVLGWLIWRVYRVMASDDPAIWAKEIEEFKRQDREAAPPEGGIVFTGSSSINFWSTLAEDMAPLPVINRGFGGSKIGQVAYYADDIVIAYRPQAVVLFAGTNDLGRFRTKTAQEVFGGYIEFVNKVHAALPQTPIYYIAITPTPARWRYWPLAQEANQLIRSYTETHPGLSFIDLSSQILGQDGKPRRELFIWDRLHPSAQGYTIWTSTIKPILEANIPASQEQATH